MTQVPGPTERFEIVRSLGRGSMGEVRLARDHERDCLVAIKTVGDCDDLALSEAKLKREGRALKSLDHPGIVRYLDTLKIGGRYVIVQEYVDGITLRQWLNRLASGGVEGLDPDGLIDEIRAAADRANEAFLELEEFEEDASEAEDPPVLELSDEVVAHLASERHIRKVCELLQEIAEALGHAHERGVLHRDLKPENIMIDREGRARIIDFGIARREGDVSLSRTRAILGTPLYMSPEHITGRVNVNERSDVFSLGIVFYEALTLRCPYTARSPMALFQQIATRPAPPVSRYNPGVSRDLEAIVHKAATKDPASRYANGKEFADDLSRLLAGRSIVARPYRYRMDRREIAVERPLRLTVSAVLWLLIGFMSFLTAFSYWTTNQDEESLVFPIVTTIFLTGIGIVSLLLGRGLLRANRWAARLTPIASAILGYIALKAVRDAWREPNAEPFVLIMYSLLGAVCFFTGYSAISRPARRWYDFARDIREDRVGGSMAGRPR